MAETVTVSYSELDTGRQCPFKHRLAYRERWQSPDVSLPLVRGTLWHNVMESHYQAIKRLRDAGTRITLGSLDGVRLSVINEWLVDSAGNYRNENCELIEWMYDGYLQYYGSDPDWRIVAVEHAPVIWLPTDRGGRSRFKLKLKIDLLVLDPRNNLWVVDHKSGKDLPKDKELEIDDQFGLYTWAMRKLGRPVHGQIHNAARTQRNKDQDRHPQPLEERFRRKPMYRTDIELDNLAVDAYRTAKKLYGTPTEQAERHPNPDTCRWRCDFTEPCLGSRKGMDLNDLLESRGYHQDFTRH